MQLSVEDCPQAKSCARCSPTKGRARRARSLLPLGAVIACVVSAKVGLTGHLLINYTPSVPRGLYWISFGEVPQREELVAIPIPEGARDLIYDREYLPRSIRLLAKPVAAVGGDKVCVKDRQFFINGEVAGNVRHTDLQGRPMPQHPMCETLRSDQVFLATTHDHSFDSRNFGPVTLGQVRGTLIPLLTVDIAPTAIHDEEVGSTE